MQKHQKLTERRIRQVTDRVEATIWTRHLNLAATYLPTEEPLPFADIEGKKFRKIETGTEWGSGFQCAWFRLEGTVPAECRGHPVVALLDFGGEGCVMDARGRPVVGITNQPQAALIAMIQAKKEVRLLPSAKGGETISLLVDAGANRIMGANPSAVFAEASIATRNEAAWDLWHRLSFLRQLMLDLPEDSRHRSVLLRGLNDACNLVGDLTAAELAAARKPVDALMALSATDSALDVTAVGHAHIDVAWLWPLRETVRKTARTFATALQMLDEYPNYRFGASQPVLYQMMKDHYPALYRRVKDAVASGRWEAQGAMWLEADTNVPSGESLIRQLLYGRRFFRDEFGIEANYLWLPDVFGYSAALPQILKKSGVSWFMTQKISWSQFNGFPHNTFYWEGIDGTQIFSHFLPNANYNVSATPREWRDVERKHQDGDRSKHALTLFGIGDGGGGPGRTHIEWTQLAADLENVPAVRMEPASEFFPKAEAAAEDLLTWRGELYLEYHRGTYTTQALVKRMNRKLEYRLRDWEWLTGVGASRLPQREHERLWKVLLLNQFHDIIPGSSINRVYREARAQYAEAEAALSGHVAAAGEAYARRVDTRDCTEPFVVRNTLSTAGQRWVLLPGSAAVQLPGGDEVPSQVVGKGVGAKTLTRLDLPAMGHVTVDRGGRRSAQENTFVVRTDRLENTRVRVDFRKDGTIGRIIDKQARRQVLTAPGNLLRLFEDRPLAYDAWDVDAYYLEKAPQNLRLVGATVLEEGPLRGAIEQRWEGPDVVLVQVIQLHADDALISFDTDVQWHAEHRMLRAEFPVNVHAEHATFEIQFGHVTRTTHDNTSWDMAQFEVCGHRWADISQPNYGVALLNDCKYGYRIKHGMMSLNLLRSPKSPDPEADMGSHRFRYALLPHAGDHVAGRVRQRAAEFNIPAEAQPALANRGTLPGRYSHVTVDADNVVIETLKPAEQGDGLVIRLFEADGCDVTTRLRFPRSIAVVSETDLMEREVATLKPKGARSLELAFKPFEIRTVLVTFR